MDTLHQLTATTPTKPKPPCATRPDDWDLDIGTPDSWQHAVQTCHGCPILAQCRELAVTLTARGMPPRSMIWAAVGYDGSGNPIDNLDHHRAHPIAHKQPQPLRIVRTGPVHVQPAAQRGPENDTVTRSPRRTIIVRRRPLPPTGTGNR